MSYEKDSSPVTFELYFPCRQATSFHCCPSEKQALTIQRWKINKTRMKQQNQKDLFAMKTNLCSHTKTRERLRKSCSYPRINPKQFPV